LAGLTSLSPDVVNRVFEGEQECAHQQNRACCFKWDHNSGMCHSIALAEKQKDYGVLITVGLRSAPVPDDKMVSAEGIEPSTY
jgi:hypothetical protein